MKKIYSLFVLLYVLSFDLSYSQVIQNEVKAKIEVKNIEGNTVLTGTAENSSEILKSASYKLTVIKKNNVSHNESNNSQEGMFTLNPGEFKKLSTTQINVEKGDEVIVMLVFFDENKQIIGKDRIVLGDQKKKLI